MGPTLATTWQSKQSWPARDPRGTPTYCSFEIEILGDHTVETNWLDEGSWASMCSFVHLPYAQDPVDKAVVRIGTPGHFVRACRLLQEGTVLKTACANGPNPPADMRSALVLHSREPEVRMGLDGLIGTWQSATTGADLVSITVRSDARYNVQSVDGTAVDSGWVSAGDTSLELHGARNATCDYRSTGRKLTLRCHGDAAKGTQLVVFTRIR